MFKKEIPFVLFICLFSMVNAYVIEDFFEEKDWIVETGNMLFSDGLQSEDDASFYSAWRHIPETGDGDFHLTYTVKTPSGLTCGGSYLKLGRFPHPENPVFDPNTPFRLMFGSDSQCNGKHTLHAILSQENGENAPLTTRLNAVKPDGEEHTYSIRIFQNNTYIISTDGEETNSGLLEEHLLPSKTIDDPHDLRPNDWDDRPFIEDSDAVKPPDWVDEEEIVDPVAVKPKDWDEEDDGEWEAPNLPNPEYKGEWFIPRIPNPNNQGKWIPKQSPNPEYIPSDTLYQMTKGIHYIGIDIWAMTKGITYTSIAIQAPNRTPTHDLL